MTVLMPTRVHNAKKKKKSDGIQLSGGKNVATHVKMI